jgi:hypothetical protein
MELKPQVPEPPSAEPNRYASAYPEEDRAIIQPGHESKPLGPRTNRNLIIIGAVIIIAAAIIVAAILLAMTFGWPNNSDPTGLAGIQNGQYATYHMSMASSSDPTITGTLTINISNVTSTNLTIIIVLSGGGVSNTAQYNFNYSGNNWTTVSFANAGGLSGGSSNGSNLTLLGQEQLSTIYGERITNHYSMTYPEYIYEFWSGTNGCPYKMVFTTSSGLTATCILQKTNILDFKT